MKVEDSTADGVYCTTHDVKVPFCMTGFPSTKITNHGLHIDNDKGKSVIGCYIIIDPDLMVHLGLTAEFKCQVLQWDGATIHMKKPISLIG